MSYTEENIRIRGERRSFDPDRFADLVLSLAEQLAVDDLERQKRTAAAGRADSEASDE